MLVSGSVDGANNNVIEIIDVEDPSYSCPNSLTFNAFSYLRYAGGGMVDDIPFICGGWSETFQARRSDCWKL